MAHNQSGAARGAVIQGAFIGGRFRPSCITSRPSPSRPQAAAAQPIQPRMAQTQAAPRPAANPNLNSHSAHLQRIAQAKMAGARAATPAPAAQPRAAAHVSPVVQRHANGEAFQLPAHLSSFGGGGQPLPGEVRQKMESFFGTSFADVRVHIGPQASSIGALAFTQGSNLYFAPGQYNPHTTQGQHILGHELAHVVQQRAGRVSNPFGSGVAVVQNHGLEAEADRLGRLATAHTPAVQPYAPGRRLAPAAASQPTRRTPGTVQRITVTWTQAELDMFDTTHPIVNLQHTRPSNTPSTPIPTAQIDHTAANQTVNHCVPYNFIRDQLANICRLSADRREAYTKLCNIANALHIPTPGMPTSRQAYDVAMDSLMCAIGNYGGNMFVCDGSSGDGGGRHRDVPPNTFGGRASLEYHVSQLQLAMDSQMPRQQVVRQHLTTPMAQSGERSTPIVIDM